MTFQEKLDARINAVNSLLCAGLDSDSAKLPNAVANDPDPQFAFNKAIIDATHEFVAAYKPNSAFYEAQGEAGMRSLQKTMDYLRATHPEIVTIDDAKRADIGNTNIGYVKAIFDELGFDAVTIHPYLGREAVQPFLDRADKGCIVLCRTSNPGAGEFQDLRVRPGISSGVGTDSPEVEEGRVPTIPLWQHVAERVTNDWNANQNCLLVVGATYPEEMKQIRALTGDMTFLVPGIGAQGGDVKATVGAGLTTDKKGMIINSSRGIIFASSGDDFAQVAAREAQSLRDEINQYR